MRKNATFSIGPNAARSAVAPRGVIESSALLNREKRPGEGKEAAECENKELAQGKLCRRPDAAPDTVAGRVL